MSTSPHPYKITFLEEIDAKNPRIVSDLNLLFQQASGIPNKVDAHKLRLVRVAHIEMALAWDGSAIVGFGTVVRVPIAFGGCFGQIEHLMVDRVHWEQGLAGRIFEKLADKARLTWNCDYLVAAEEPYCENAKGFFRNRGFTEALPTLRSRRD